MRPGSCLVVARYERVEQQEEGGSHHPVLFDMSLICVRSRFSRHRVLRATGL
jgi:hypothetical protein